MSKSNPFAAPDALAHVPGAQRSIDEAVANHEPTEVNSTAPDRVDAGAVTTEALAEVHDVLATPALPPADDATSDAGAASDASNSPEADVNPTTTPDEPKTVETVNPDDYNKDQLVEMATAEGVSTSGTKAELADAINAKRAGA